MFQVTLDNQETNITPKDVEALEEYEKLLYRQNQRALVKVDAGGTTMLRSSEKQELNQLVRLRKKKNALISRLTLEKEEKKKSEMVEKIINQT